MRLNPKSRAVRRRRCVIRPRTSATCELTAFSPQTDASTCIRRERRSTKSRQPACSGFRSLNRPSLKLRRLARTRRHRSRPLRFRKTIQRQKSHRRRRPNIRRSPSTLGRRALRPIRYRREPPIRYRREPPIRYRREPPIRYQRKPRTRDQRPSRRIACRRRRRNRCAPRRLPRRRKPFIPDLRAGRRSTHTMSVPSDAVRRTRSQPSTQRVASRRRRPIQPVASPPNQIYRSYNAPSGYDRFGTPHPHTPRPYPPPNDH